MLNLGTKCIEPVFDESILCYLVVVSLAAFIHPVVNLFTSSYEVMSLDLIQVAIFLNFLINFLWWNDFYGGIILYLSLIWKLFEVRLTFIWS